MAQDNYEAMMGAINNTIAYLEGKERAFTTLGINIPLLNINLLQELSSIIEMVVIFNNAASTGGELIDIDKARHYRSNFTGKFGNPDSPTAKFKKRMVKVSAPLLKEVLNQKNKEYGDIPIEFIQIYPILKDDMTSLSLLLVAESGGKPVLREVDHPKGPNNILEELEPCPQPPCQEL